MLFVVTTFFLVLWRRDEVNTSIVIGLVMLFKAVENLTDVACGLAQRHGDNDLLSHSLFLRGIFGIVSFGAIFWITENLAFATAGIVIAWLGVFLFHDWLLTRRWHGDLRSWNWPAMARMAWKSLPLGIGVSISGFNVVLPRLVLEHYDGLQALGIFSAIAYLLTLGNLVVGAMGNTLLTRLAHFWLTADIRAFTFSIAKATSVLVVICLIGTIAAQLGGPQILEVLYGKAFSQNGDLLVIVAAAGSLIMIGTFWSYALLGTKSFVLQLWLNIATLFSVAAASFFFIPTYGVFGAAYALVVLGVVRCLLCALNYGYSVSRLKASVSQVDLEA